MKNLIIVLFSFNIIGCTAMAKIENENRDLKATNNNLSYKIQVLEKEVEAKDRLINKIPQLEREIENRDKYITEIRTNCKTDNASLSSKVIVCENEVATREKILSEIKIGKSVCESSLADFGRRYTECAEKLKTPEITAVSECLARLESCGKEKDDQAVNCIEKTKLTEEKGELQGMKKILESIALEIAPITVSKFLIDDKYVRVMLKVQDRCLFSAQFETKDDVDPVTKTISQMADAATIFKFLRIVK